MIIALRRLSLLVLLLIVANTVAFAATDKEKARKTLEKRYGAVSLETMQATLNPPNAEDLQLFLTAGMPADEVMKIDMGEEIVPVSPLQYVMMFACESKPVAEVVKVILDAGADPNRRDTRDGGTPLMRASQCPDVMRLLLKAGANPNLRNERGDTALRTAILFGTPETMRILIRGGADVEGDRDQLLKSAARSKEKLAVIREALGTPAVSSQPSARSFSQALIRRDLATLRANLAAGTWSVEPVRNVPPLIYLLERCKPDEDPAPLITTIGLLLERGARIGDTGPPLANSVLHVAANQCPVEAVRTLLTAGADPNVTNSVHQTALLGAVMRNRPDVVEALLDAGAKVDRDSRFFAKSKPEILKLLK
ncbi:MAG: ankyrin repeat domain-containing protein [Thermoanaerobaculia bacterium]